jgi:hypothetical protein
MATLNHGVSQRQRSRSTISVDDSISKRPKLIRSLSETIIQEAEAKFKIDRTNNVIADRISMTEVVNFFGMKRIGFRYIFVPEKSNMPNSKVYGTLIIIELIKAIHESISTEIYAILLESLGGRTFLSGYGNTDTCIEGVIKNPDGGVYPKDLVPDNIHILAATADGDAFPNIVWEVAFQNEQDSLIEELLLWISPSTSVQVAIGVKILDQRLLDKTVRMTAFMYRKKQPNQSTPPIFVPYHKGSILIPQFPPEIRVDFGTDIPTAIVASLTISFPESDFYFGTSNLSDPNRTIDIPLIELQSIALSKLPHVE